MKKFMMITMMIGMSIFGTQTMFGSTNAKNPVTHHNTEMHAKKAFATPGCNCPTCHDLRVKEMMRAKKHGTWRDKAHKPMPAPKKNHKHGCKCNTCNPHKHNTHRH